MRYLSLLLLIAVSVHAQPRGTPPGYIKRLVALDGNGKVTKSLPWAANITTMTTAIAEEVKVGNVDPGTSVDWRFTTGTLTLPSGEWVEMVENSGWSTRQSARVNADKAQRLREEQARLSLIASELTRLGLTSQAAKATEKSNAARDAAALLEP